MDAKKQPVDYSIKSKPTTKITDAKQQNVDDPNKFVSILSGNPPANPVAVATIISRRAIGTSDSNVQTVLGRSVKQLLSDGGSFLYRNPIDYALNAAPHQVLSSPPSTTRPSGYVYDAHAILTQLNANGITCDTFRGASVDYQRNTLVNLGLAAAKDAPSVVLSVLQLCPIQPHVGVGVRIGQVWLSKITGGDCSIWRRYTQQMKQSTTREVVEADRVASGVSQGLTVEQIIAEVDRECFIWQTDWPEFLNHLPAPSTNPSHNPRTCEGFMSMTDQQKRDAFLYSGWTENEVSDGIRRLDDWCRQNSALELAKANVCSHSNWRVRSQLVASIRSATQPIVLRSVRDAMSMSTWEQDLFAYGETVSLPVLCQDTYEHCTNAGTPPHAQRTQVQISNAAYRDPNVARPWLVTGTGVIPDGGFDALDPIQGAVGDCYLVAAMSAIAFSRPGLLENIVRRVGQGQNGSSRYSVRIRNENIEVDDCFQVSPFYLIGMYCQGVRQNAQWPGLIEKAYAAWRTRNTSGYPNMQTLAGDYFGGDIRSDARRSVASGIGHVEFPHADLAGGEPFWWITYFRNGDECWNRINSHCEANQGRVITPMSGSTYPSSQQQGLLADIIGPSDLVDLGFVPGHAYSIFGVSRSPKAIIMRNPWGHGTPDASQLVAIPGGWNHLNVSGEYNGVFAIKPDAFARYFGAVYGALL